MSALGGNCLNMLLFSVGNVCFGIDADQVEGMSVYRTEESNDLFWFHDLLNYGCDSITYSSPTIITIRTGGDRSWRVIIDSMEDIAEFSQDDIRPFPPLLEPLTLRMGMWGILLRNGSMVLLIDVARLAKNLGPQSTDRNC